MTDAEEPPHPQVTFCKKEYTDIQTDDDQKVIWLTMTPDFFFFWFTGVVTNRNNARLDLDST